MLLLVHLEGTKLYRNNLHMKGLCVKTASNHMMGVCLPRHNAKEKIGRPF